MIVYGLLIASCVGRKLGTIDLAGFSLGCLVGNLTCLSIMEGSLTAADTLMPRAFAAKQYSEVARLSIRAFCIGCGLLVVPIVPLCFMLGRFLESLGQDSEASYLAQAWIRVYFLGALPNLAFRVIMRFLLAQQRPWPLVLASFIPAIFIHPFILPPLVSRVGLVGSAWSIVLVQWMTIILLLTYLRVHPAYVCETWPGISRPLIEKSLQWRQLGQFLRLSIGGILSMNEWWFFEIMCFVAGSFGVVSLDAHTVAYNLVPLLFMLPLGVSIGLSVRMGHVIADEAQRARSIAIWCIALITCLGAIVSYALHFFRYQVILIFTNDEGLYSFLPIEHTCIFVLAILFFFDLFLLLLDVLNLALQIWTPVCFYIFLIYILATSCSIYRALGMQWRGAAIISVMLYVFTMPFVLYFAMWRKGGLLAQWKVLPVCYTFMNAALVLGYACLDWEKHAEKIKEHIESSGENHIDLEVPLSEETPLIVV